jgi:hypothetical protein
MYKNEFSLSIRKCTTHLGNNMFISYMEKEVSIHQDKANNYKEFQNVFQVKQVFQANLSSKCIPSEAS